jgi:hypothetical protein
MREGKTDRERERERERKREKLKIRWNYATPTRRMENPIEAN